MKIFEKTIIGFIIISLLTKLLVLPGSILFTAIPFLTLSVFYLCFSFLFFNNIPVNLIFSGKAYSQVKWQRLVLTIIVGIEFSIATFGLLYGFNHWHGAKVILSIGILLLALTGIILLIQYLIYKSKFHQAILIRNGLMLLISIILYFYQ